jgi:hypothetical protein
MPPPEPDEHVVNEDALSPSSEPFVSDANVARPDWLVGPDEGARSEQQRLSKDTPEEPAAPLRLVKSGEGVVERERSEPPPGQMLPSAKPAAPGAPPAPARPVPWTAAASSVPRLRLEPAPPPAPARARAGAPAKGDDEEENEASARLDAIAFPDDAPATPVAARPGPTLAPLREAWWLIALEELRSNRRTQILVAVALVGALAAWIFWPQGQRGTDLANIRQHPDKFDSHIVRVSGRVGEVFNVGSGYAFYLHQGRDTIVVFTRSRVPVPRSNVTVVAAVSTGFLDGAPRQALFEESR